MRGAQVPAQLADAAIVDVGQWEVIIATGGDRLSFLHRLLTASVENLAAGQGRRALLLSIKGHVVAELRVCVRADDVMLLVPPGQGEVAAAALSRYAIMDDVALTRATELRMKILAIFGARAALRLQAAGLAVPESVALGPELAHAEVEFSAENARYQVSLMHSPGYGSDGFWVVGDAGAIDRLRAVLGAAGVGHCPTRPPRRCESWPASRSLASRSRPTSFRWRSGWTP